MELLLYFVGVAALIFGGVKLVDKFATSSTRLIFTSVFWLLTIFLVYLIFNAVNDPIKFEKIKQKRYQVAVNKLQDIRKAQLAHKTIKGSYAANFNDLVSFIENEQFAIIERKDTSVIDTEKNEAFRITVDETGEGGYFKDIVILDTLGFVPVKDSLFKNSNRYKELDIVETEDFKARVALDAKTIEKNDLKIPVFEAKIAKKKILQGLSPDLIQKELNIIGVDEINGDHVILGSLEEINTNGNWPKKYGDNE